MEKKTIQTKRLSSAQPPSPQKVRTYLFYLHLIALAFITQLYTYNNTNLYFYSKYSWPLQISQFQQLFWTLYHKKYVTVSGKESACSWWGHSLYLKRRSQNNSRKLVLTGPWKLTEIWADIVTGTCGFRGHASTEMHAFLLVKTALCIVCLRWHSLTSELQINPTTTIQLWHGILNPFIQPSSK